MLYKHFFMQGLYAALITPLHGQRTPLVKGGGLIGSSHGVSMFEKATLSLERVARD